MIEFREKFYARRDENVEWKEEITSVDIQRSKSFERDYNDISMRLSIPTIKKLIKDINDGFFYVDGPNGGDTHYLSDYSKPDKFLIYSKSINVSDRLNYAIYKPDKINGNAKIVLMRCKGHGLLDGRNYSEMED
jgi:hypothetical protein